jgi:hypothetical protein
MEFKVNAYDPKGRDQVFIVAADDARSAAQQIRSRGFFPFDVQPLKRASIESAARSSAKKIEHSEHPKFVPQKNEKNEKKANACGIGCLVVGVGFFLIMWLLNAVDSSYVEAEPAVPERFRSKRFVETDDRESDQRRRTFVREIESGKIRTWSELEEAVLRNSTQEEIEEMRREFRKQDEAFR